MDSAVIVAILSLLGTLAGSFGGIITANKLTTYRIQQLEEKVERHNNAVERLTVLEVKFDDMVKNFEEAMHHE